MEQNNLSMKAAICTQYGPPEVLEIRDIEKPTPKDKEILVKVMASAVNSADVRIRGLVVEGFMKMIMRLVLGFKGPRKKVLGTVFSGVVEKIGKEVASFKVGDEVFGSTGFQLNAHAEYLTIAESGPVSLKPANASFEEAAAIAFGGQTAIYFLHKAKIRKQNNTKILIYGATGSVGTAAVQIAQSYQADITAVCSSSGESLVHRLGVKKIIKYDQEDFTKHPEKFDIIFDAVGKTSKKQCKQLLNSGGQFFTVGGMDVADEQKAYLDILRKLFEEGHYQATIDRVFRLDEVVEAHRYVDTGRKKGNVVLQIAE